MLPIHDLERNPKFAQPILAILAMLPELFFLAEPWRQVCVFAIAMPASRKVAKVDSLALHFSRIAGFRGLSVCCLKFGAKNQCSTLNSVNVP